MNNNNAHQGPARSQAEQLEAMLEVAHRLSVEKRHIVAERDRVVAQHEHAIADRDRVITEQRHAIAEHERVNIEQRHKIAELECILAEHQRAIAEHHEKIAKQERVTSERVHMIATIAEQADFVRSQAHKLTTMATAAVAAPHTIAAPGNAGPGSAPNTIAPGGAPTGDDSLDDIASGSSDALDDASSGTDDDDLDDAASGAAEDILDDAASRADDALDDQTAESYHAAKRRRLNQQVRDVLGEEVTRQCLLEVARPFTIIDVGVLARIYELVIRRPLIPAGVDLGKLAQKLARLEGLRRWPPRRAKADPPELATMYLLRFSDMDHDTPRQTQLHQLGLSEGQGAVVLGPRLCYVLVSMGGIRLKHMSGAILDRMFRSITKKSLGELTVVTKDFVGRMTADKLCRLVKAWVRKLRKFIVEGRIERLQEAMAQCNDRYRGQCPMGANGAHSDPTGEVAKRVLKQSSDCRLLLGLDDAQKLIALCKRFFATVGDDVDQRTAAHLRQIADS
ncbi:hypothetical protein GGI17_000593 [Coemansia sp. S146]|nr:hypothetical protein GGI17_000593 [Coemansia sp. S146]